MTMSDRIAVMDQGRVLQVGTPAEIYEQPTSRFVADFIGEANILPCQVTGRNNGLATVRVSDTLTMQAQCSPNLSVGQAGSVMIRPEKITIEPENSNRNNHGITVTGRVNEAIYTGTATLFEVKIADDLVIRVHHQNMSAGNPLVPARRGETVRLNWQTAAARVLPA
jgi:ABC-type Fe3+/spermidine/putrescine transport system ATPase subunit